MEDSLSLSLSLCVCVCMYEREEGGCKPLLRMATSGRNHDKSRTPMCMPCSSLRRSLHANGMVIVRTLLDELHSGHVALTLETRAPSEGGLAKCPHREHTNASKGSDTSMSLSRMTWSAP